MHLISYRRGAEVRHGVREDDQVTDLGPGDLSGAIAVYAQRAPVVGGDPFPLAAVELLAPVLHPPKLLAAAANYQDHVREGGGEPLDKSRLVPRLFLKPASCLVGPDASVALPSFSRELDWEAELAVIIGRGGTNLTVAEALEHVFGYACANDVSARSMDYGFERDPGAAVDYFDWLAGKWGDGFAPLGPVVVTADEVPDPQALSITLDLNGERQQDGSTADMIFSVAELVAHASMLCTLEPGDVLLTGTPAGTGAAVGRFLADGDRMTVTIGGLGSLTTDIVGARTA